jgi:hypothetical protein
MCTQDRQGAAMVEVIVDGGTGRIEEISVGGDFRGESRVCIEEAIRRLVFPPLSGRRERLHYVYEFRAPRSPQ